MTRDLIIPACVQSVCAVSLPSLLLLLVARVSFHLGRKRGVEEESMASKTDDAIAVHLSLGAFVGKRGEKKKIT